MTDTRAPFVHRLNVRYSDLDTNQHVNNARYNSYLEEARLAFLREYNIPGGVGQVQGLAVARIEVDYIAPIRFEPEPLEIAVWVEKLGGRSITLRHTISHYDTLRAKAGAVLVAYDYSVHATRALSDEERSAFRRALIVTE